MRTKMKLAQTLPFDDEPHAQGLVYWIEQKIPNMISGGAHSCVIVSSASYGERTGRVVVAPLRTAGPTAYRIPVCNDSFAKLTFWRLPSCRTLDLAQLGTVHVDQLEAPQALLRDSVLNYVQEIVPTLYQFNAPWQIRGTLAEIDDERGSRTVVLIQQDEVLRSGFDYFVALNYVDGNPGWFLETVNADTIVSYGRQLSRAQQLDLNRRLERIFGIRSMCSNCLARAA